MEKYKDELKVTDLITRKTAAKQYEDNPDFPDQEDWYKCGFWYAHSLFTCHIYIYVYWIHLNTKPYPSPGSRNFGCIGVGKLPRRLIAMPGWMKLELPALAKWTPIQPRIWCQSLSMAARYHDEKRIKNTPLESLYGIFANNIYNKKVYTNTIGMVPPYWGRTLWQPRPRRGICKVQGPRPLGNVSHPTKVEERVEEKAVEERAAPRRKQPRRQRQLFRKQRKYLDCL